ncbi:hypothetical protein [Oceaniferula spumae]
MKIILSLLNLLAGLVLVRFTISKFAAWPISVAAFEDMAKPLGIDPTMFRIGTGFIIGFAALFFFVNAILILRKCLERNQCVRLFTIANLYGIGAMVGALFSEFFLRTEVKWMLVYIAAAIICIALINLFSHRQKITNLLKKVS